MSNTTANSILQFCKPFFKKTTTESDINDLKLKLGNIIEESHSLSKPTERYIQTISDEFELGFEMKPEDWAAIRRSSKINPTLHSQLREQIQELLFKIEQKDTSIYYYKRENKEQQLKRNNLEKEVDELLDALDEIRTKQQKSEENWKKTISNVTQHQEFVRIIVRDKIHEFYDFLVKIYHQLQSKFETKNQQLLRISNQMNDLKFFVKKPEKKYNEMIQVNMETEFVLDQNELSNIENSDQKSLNLPNEFLNEQKEKETNRIRDLSNFNSISNSNLNIKPSNFKIRRHSVSDIQFSPQKVSKYVSTDPYDFETEKLSSNKQSITVPKLKLNNDISSGNKRDVSVMTEDWNSEEKAEPATYRLINSDSSSRSIISASISVRSQKYTPTSQSYPSIDSRESESETRSLSYHDIKDANSQNCLKTGSEVPNLKLRENNKRIKSQANTQENINNLDEINRKIKHIEYLEQEMKKKDKENEMMETFIQKTEEEFSALREKYDRLKILEDLQDSINAANQLENEYKSMNWKILVKGNHLKEKKERDKTNQEKTELRNLEREKERLELQKKNQWHVIMEYSQKLISEHEKSVEDTSELIAGNKSYSRLLESLGNMIKVADQLPEWKSIREIAKWTSQSKKELISQGIKKIDFSSFRQSHTAKMRVSDLPEIKGEGQKSSQIRESTANSKLLRGHLKPLLPSANEVSKRYERADKEKNHRNTEKFLTISSTQQ
eukprot:gb/GECH01004334.1/.p1 GENE.gb/GECH01004334.1/~~gb/GECH01004334.1/.p1  ORF type:complete len:726 (+),score=193.60 gb/GECH01004334.1/:1-2178(+)